MDIREQFIQFCENRPCRRGGYADSRNCFLAQFGKSLHPGEEVLAGHNYFVVGKERKKIVVLDEHNHEDMMALLISKSFGAVARKLRANTPALPPIDDELPEYFGQN